MPITITTNEELGEMGLNTRFAEGHEEDLDLPRTWTFAPPPGSVAYTAPRIPIKMIEDEDKNYVALLLNFLSTIALFALVYLPVANHFQSVKLGLFIAISMIFLLLLFFWKRLYSRPNYLEADVYQDPIFGGPLLVYMADLRFTGWWYSWQRRINFRKRQINRTMSDGTAIKFQSKDGYELAAGATLFTQRGSTEDALSCSLRFNSDEEADQYAIANLKQALSNMGGGNNYQTMLDNKSRISSWVGSSYGNRDMLSLFEQQIGYSFDDPVLEGFDLTAESQKIRDVKAKMQAVAEGTAKLRGLNVSPDEAVHTAQALEGTVKRTITTTKSENSHKYEGLPQGLIALGESAIIPNKGN